MSRHPTWFTSMRQPLYDTSCPGMSQVKSTSMTAKFGSFFNHVETDEKRQNVINSSMLLSYVWFLLFLQSMFLLSYLLIVVDINFCWQCNCRNVYDYSCTVCLHFNFVILKKYYKLATLVPRPCLGICTPIERSAIGLLTLCVVTLTHIRWE